MVDQKKYYRRGVVAGSFDPVHNGHLGLIRHASKQCQEVLVVVATNPKKKHLFTAAERQAMVHALTHDLMNVRVVTYDGLLADFVRREGCEVVFRGIRNEADRRYEMEQEALTRMFVNKLDGVRYSFVTTAEYDDWSVAAEHYSSSLLKFLVEQGLVNPNFAPSSVYAALELRLRRVCTIGVVGGIATGKSTVVQELAGRLRYLLASSGVNVHVISFDELLHRVYDDPSPGPQHLREKLRERFGDEVLTPDGKKVDRAVLRARLFGALDVDRRADNLRFVQDCTTEYVMANYRDALRGLTGIVLVEMAQMLELDLQHLVCDRVIHVRTSLSHANSAALDRGLNPRETQAIREVQAGRGALIEALRLKAAQEGQGFVLNFENDRFADLKELVASFAPELLRHIDREVETLKRLGTG